MTLRREARGGCNLCQRLVRVVDQRPGALDSTPFDKRAGGYPSRCPEGTRKVIEAEPGATGQIANVDRTIDVRLDEHLNALQARPATSLRADGFSV